MEFKKDLKKGTKLIFIAHGGTISTNKGYVYTFNNWKKSSWNGDYYFQSKELLEQGNTEHTMDIYTVEIFDENIHKEFVMVTKDILRNDLNDFVKRFGA